LSPARRLDHQRLEGDDGTMKSHQHTQYEREVPWPYLAASPTLGCGCTYARHP
jgi:hypothetical protein